jgi:hypothetical protein
MTGPTVEQLASAALGGSEAGQLMATCRTTYLTVAARRVGSGK